jgi:16S rRNA G527 N7-methylase RsmG
MQRCLRNPAHRERQAQILNREFGDQTRKQLLHYLNLIFTASNRHNLAFAKVAAQSRHLLEHLKDTLEELKISAHRAQKEDQVVDIQGCAVQH